MQTNNNNEKEKLKMCMCMCVCVHVYVCYLSYTHNISHIITCELRAFTKPYRIMAVSSAKDELAMECTDVMRS